MNYTNAIRTMRFARRRMPAFTIDFVNPAMSSLLAAASLREECIKAIKFGANAASYIQTNGLRDALDGNYREPTRSGLCGHTYSQLTRLQHPSDVDFCNKVIVI